jgi:tRNA dimethylallyltransferase
MVPEDRHVKKVVVLTGPTAVGKTAFSLSIAKYLGTEIINTDASQFRKGLDIGTAKIDLKETDVPHHLIDFLDPEAEFSIKDFQDLARKKIAELHSLGMIPLLVGGSGLYINAALGDYKLDSPGRNLDFEKKYAGYSNAELHGLLARLDPPAAEKIHPNNRRRVLRALELAEAGERISENLSGRKLLYDALVICLVTDRATLYERINRRVGEMIKNGWLDEIRTLLAKGIDFSKIKDIGYKELAEYVVNGGDLELVLDDIRKKTRNYAKRQMTWFKNQMACVFVEVDYDNPQVTENRIKGLIAGFLPKREPAKHFI